MADVKVCIFCSNEKDDRCGELLSKDGINVRTHCLFAATELGQHGASDNDGILGFWPEDILNVFEMSRNNYCEYCLKTGATVFCSLSEVEFISNLRF